MNFTRSLRAIHRDLGFLVVGVSLVYGISGIFLNHLGEKDPAFRTEEKTLQLPAYLSETELSTTWSAGKNLPPLKRILRIDEDHLRLFLDGGAGVYNSANGQLDYETHKKNVLIYWINRLHYNKVKGWSPIADFFAVSLILLAITGLFLVKGKKSLSGSGKWFLLAGILIPVLFGIFFMR
ncbi:MAG: PepSY-associated TM helix domain-containing protein [Dysgonamonadaceae bacterium]|jgi:hypothetical protein|nr:PepSY-associated TM helix domain-containing protein [Dysgonamonadaceae bacterium]